jgi:endonuclease I/chitodextrinase
MIKKGLLLIFITSFSISFSQEQYYNDVDLTLYGMQLKEALASKITTTHTNILPYTPGVWEASKITDINPDNSAEVILIYGWENGSDQDITNDRTRNKNLQDTGSGESFVWNREHVFSKSLANPVLIGVGSSRGPGSDAHNLRPVDRSTNSSRNNFKFTLGQGNSGRSSVTYSGPEGPETRGWYPGDEWKGDVARMMMYMYLRYGEQCLPSAVGVGSQQFIVDDMIDLFLQWNVEDPVSEFEKGRNTYHGNTTNTYAQGNRNPFIDNPYLATRIWGGESAEDLWGNYTSSDTEAPTTPTNVVASNETSSTIEITWTASSDNIGVTQYRIYIDAVLSAQTTEANFKITNLQPGTSYNIQIEARDRINNKSEKSNPITATTTSDTTAPSVPSNITASNISGTGFKINWDAATDDTAVTAYNVFINAALTATTSERSYTVSGLTASTTYQVAVSAKDAANNESAQSSAVSITTTNGGSNGIEELFISEYVEPDGGNNKAIEIVNLTSAVIDLAAYSIKKQSNGSGDWIHEFPLSGTINVNDVTVIINYQADNSILVSEADIVGPSTNFGSPVNFNGNDPVGLFKEGVLIDIVGQLNNSSKHIENATYRRKRSVSKPNTTFDPSEWDILAANTFEGIGSHSSSLSAKKDSFQAFKMYPNPVQGDQVYLNLSKEATVSIYNVLGKLVSTSKVTKNNNAIQIGKLASGIYLVKIQSEKQYIAKKLIKN